MRLTTFERSGSEISAPARRFTIQRARVRVLDALIDIGNQEEVLSTVLRWASDRESRYVCSSNVHSVVTARYDSSFLEVLNLADMTLPDGAPVAWAMRRQGFANQQRVAGPDLMQDVLALAQANGLKVFFYGSTQRTLDLLREKLSQQYPDLQIAGMHSPPFGEQDEAQRDGDAKMINDSGAQILFVGLGCPKQERWMRQQRGRVQAVMFGFGAAFDFHAGTLKRAPVWMQDHGLEWVHRLCSEPRRLWKRYLFTNTLFVLGIAAQLLRPDEALRASRRA
jgi:N-acetylglucosaminyldiphosphoundecaprenol N-acetyl-beta-D-mannosaminyltransferase